MKRWTLSSRGEVSGCPRTICNEPPTTEMAAVRSRQTWTTIWLLVSAGTGMAWKLYRRAGAVSTSSGGPEDRGFLPPGEDGLAPREAHPAAGDRAARLTANHPGLVRGFGPGLFGRS